MNTIVALLLNSGIPPSGEMEHVGGGSQREAYPGGLGAENKNVETTIVVEMPLEAIDDSLTLRNGGVAIYEINSIKSELGARQFNKPVLDLPMLDED
jgi:hypothetical protein